VGLAALVAVPALALEGLGEQGLVVALAAGLLALAALVAELVVLVGLVPAVALVVAVVAD
jgi:hypothetical protein